MDRFLGRDPVFPPLNLPAKESYDRARLQTINQADDGTTLVVVDSKVYDISPWLIDLEEEAGGEECPGDVTAFRTCVDPEENGDRWGAVVRDDDERAYYFVGHYADKTSDNQATPVAGPFGADKDRRPSQSGESLSSETPPSSVHGGVVPRHSSSSSSSIAQVVAPPLFSAPLLTAMASQVRSLSDRIGPRSSAAPASVHASGSMSNQPHGHHTQPSHTTTTPQPHYLHVASSSSSSHHVRPLIPANRNQQINLAGPVPPGTSHLAMATYLLARRKERLMECQRAVAVAHEELARAERDVAEVEHVRDSLVLQACEGERPRWRAWE